MPEVLGWCKAGVRADVFVCVSSCAARAQLPGGASSALGHCPAEQSRLFALPKLGLLAFRNFSYVRCSSISLGRNSSLTEHQCQWRGGGVLCPQQELCQQSPAARGAALSPGALQGMDGWMDGWSIQLSRV